MDNERPVAELQVNDDDNCRKFSHGDKITGQFTATDKYLDHWSLGSSWGANTLQQFDDNIKNTDLGDFSFDTNSDSELCGKISLTVLDKRIINSSYTKRGTPAEKIICLQPKV